MDYMWILFLTLGALVPSARSGYTGHVNTTAADFFANEQRCLLRILGNRQLVPVGTSAASCEDLDASWNISFVEDSVERGDEILENRDEFIMARFSAFAQYWLTSEVAPWPGLLEQTPSGCITLRELIWVYLIRALAVDVTEVSTLTERLSVSAGLMESLWLPYMQHLGVWCEHDRELNWFVLAYVFFVTLLVVGVVTYCGHPPQKR